MFKFLKKIETLEKIIGSVGESSKQVSNRTTELEKHAKELKRLIPEFVECETCGCLLDKNTAVRGKSTIKEIPQTTEDIFSGRVHRLPFMKEVIKEHYFCKVHGKGK